MPLDLNGYELKEQLDRIESEHKESSLEAQVDTEGVTAELSHTQEELTIIAYLKARWNGDKVAGAKIRWTL
jgi:hypothetical protein